MPGMLVYHVLCCIAHLEFHGMPFLHYMCAMHMNLYGGLREGMCCAQHAYAQNRSPDVKWTQSVWQKQ